MHLLITCKICEILGKQNQTFTEKGNRYESNRHRKTGGGMCYNRANRKSRVYTRVLADFVHFLVLKVLPIDSVNPHSGRYIRIGSLALDYAAK